MTNVTVFIKNHMENTGNQMKAKEKYDMMDSMVEMKGWKFCR